MSPVERRFRINSPAVASEVIEGEAVIMNLKSGVYFSTRQIGGLLWSWIEQGMSVSAMVHALAGTSESGPEIVEQAVARFIAKLLEHDLIRELASDAPVPLFGPPPLPAGTVFAAPVLDVYTDMQDLLLLDPIHDVDEAVGWPSPKPPEESVA
jgi:coenzyme PQQ synthesis protein D (PqqD)